MKWAKTTRYQSTITIRNKVFNVLCESDFDNGFAVYINGEFLADFEELPTRDQLVNTISEYNTLENTIKDGYAASGVYQ